MNKRFTNKLKDNTNELRLRYEDDREYYIMKANDDYYIGGEAIDKLAHYEDMEEQGGNMINTENIKELLYYRKAIKILKEDDSSREVWYVGENGKTYCMRGNTVILALQRGIYRFYDTCEEAEKSKSGAKIDESVSE